MMLFKNVFKNFIYFFMHRATNQWFSIVASHSCTSRPCGACEEWSEAMRKLHT